MTLSFNQLLEMADEHPPERRNGYKIYRGFTFRHHTGIMHLIPDQFHLVEKWSIEPYRIIWISKKYKSIFSYCEGDIILEVYETMEDFKKHIKNAADYYKEH